MELPANQTVQPVRITSHKIRVILIALRLMSALHPSLTNITKLLGVYGYTHLNASQIVDFEKLKSF
jgi:hypothetical protein